jgi:hypothetical protein
MVAQGLYTGTGGHGAHTGAGAHGAHGAHTVTGGQMSFTTCGWYNVNTVQRSKPCITRKKKCQNTKFLLTPRAKSAFVRSILDVSSPDKFVYAR